MKSISRNSNLLKYVLLIVCTALIITIILLFNVHINKKLLSITELIILLSITAAAIIKTKKDS